MENQDTTPEESKPTVQQAAQTIFDSLTNEGFTLDEKVEVKDQFRMLLQAEAESQAEAEAAAHQNLMSNLKRLRASI
ncbi:hypothetical protein [Spirosoma sp.]|uniref:hypothetical protein n=1 Tax=Spirosoma sp. TaxID=1899569 RepID=UPI0026023B3C|nr:hypothetical protein [Spirosoma sp.]MCX6217600.1 hypothetical protein [Spirosoma sp.]